MALVTFKELKSHKPLNGENPFLLTKAIERLENNKIEKLIDDIVCIVQDKEVSNAEEYINMEVKSNKEEIIKVIIEEIKERL